MFLLAVKAIEIDPNQPWHVPAAAADNHKSAAAASASRSHAAQRWPFSISAGKRLMVADFNWDI